MRKALRKGEEVMIYYDPLTEKKAEGLAVLLQRSRSTISECDLWKVRFLGFEAEARLRGLRRGAG
jgi:hypothetical protein